MNIKLSKLRKNGHRITFSRKKILNILNSIPLTAQEIYKILKQKNIKINLVTIYRTLKMLNYYGIIKKIQFKDKAARFEIFSKDNHHHHLVCEKCGLVEDILLNEDIIMKQIKTKTKFKVKNHSLEFFGLCYKCQI